VSMKCWPQSRIWLMEFDPLSTAGERSVFNICALCPRKFKQLRHATFARFAGRSLRTESHFTSLSTSGSVINWRVQPTKKCPCRSCKSLRLKSETHALLDTRVYLQDQADRAGGENTE
jgi:hypothetical protein